MIEKFRIKQEFMVKFLMDTIAVDSKSKRSQNGIVRHNMVLQVETFNVGTVCGNDQIFMDHFPNRMDNQIANWAIQTQWVV